ncbi:non-ribosomal peptide synthase/polyketide synthase [Pseudomonas sp.]|uniref:non-ribosomal peptide synthase/polyketide synthase n=1 Tax=Pseudomonas sp. TaxID=306 RepID=UPI003D09AEE5
MQNKTAQHIEDVYPLSPLQQGMLFQSLLHQESGVYLMQDRYRIGGPLAVEPFLEAWRRVVAAHPALRTSFLWKTQKQPLQVVHRSVGDVVEYIDLQHLDAAQQEAHIQDLLQQEQRNGFNLAKPPLIRFRLVCLGENRHELIRSFHHILMDAWCISLIMVDFVDTYEALRNGRTPAMRAPRPYREYIGWLPQQSQPLAKAFWQEQLHGLDAPTPLTIEQQPRQSQYSEAVLVDDDLVQLDSTQTQHLMQFCQRHRVTPNTLFQGAWALLLSRYSGNPDVLFGVTVAGRPPQLSGVEEMIGLFINTLPLRVQVRPDLDLVGWLQALQRLNLDLREFEHSSLVDIQGWTDFPRGEELFDSILVYENAPIDAKLLSGDLAFSLDGMEHSVHTHYGLTVVVIPGEQLAIRISYDRRRFSRDSIERLLGHLRQIVLGMLARPTATVGDLELLDAHERQQLLVDWNQTALPLPIERTYAALFAEQVAQHPDKLAVVCEGESLSYAELDARSSRIAAALIESGAQPDRLVAVLADRGLAYLVGLIGILKAGACYLPLEVKHPPERLAEILDLSQAPLLLAGREQSALARDLCGPRHTQVIDIEALWQHGPAPVIEPRGSADDLAYVIFTSGSTGTPKGALVEQRGMLNNILGKVPTLGLGEHDRIAQTASVAFDISVWQLLAAPLVGATVHILPDAVSQDPERLLQALESQRLTLWEAVPAVIRGVLAASTADTDLGALRWLLPTGEALPPALCRDWFARYPRTPLMNAYGPAECADDVAFHAITEASDEQAQAMPVGRPTPNTQLFVLDAQLRPVPIGVPGEICVAGAGVGRGYLNDPERTRLAFVEHPLQPGARFYRTGDLGRYRADGVIEFLGRRDQQVKIRGHRIELGEIEARLQRHPAIREAAVIARADARNEAQLVGYWARQPGAALDEATLRAELARQLPAYMVPAYLIELDTLPLNANGKVDRKRLTAQELAINPANVELIAPDGDTEQRLYAIWQDVLALEPFSVTDSFFALGGHSLLATQVLSRIRATFSRELPLKSLFEHPSVRQLAQAIEGFQAAAPAEPARPSIPRQPRPERLPLSFAQQRLWFVEQLNPNTAHFNIPFALRLTGTLDVAALRASFQWLIERHEVLRTAFLNDAGEPWQQVIAVPDFDLPISEVAGDEPLPEALRDWFDTPFDLARPPLLRARLLVRDAQTHDLAIVLHHLVSDAWSATLAMRELAQIYAALQAGQTPQLPPLPIQYADFVLWQRAHLTPEVLDRQLGYWKQTLARADGEAQDYLLRLPTDAPRPAVQSHRSGTLGVQLSPAASERVRALAARQQQSAFSLVFAAFAAFLQRLSGQDELILGTPVSNRLQAETESLLGILLNNVPVRVSFPAGQTFAELARQVSDSLLDAQRHQDLPFERLIDHLALPRSLSHAPLFQVMVAQQLAVERRIRFPGLDFEVLDTALSHSEYDLDFHIVTPAEGPIEFNLMHALDLFGAATAERWLQGFVHLFERLLDQPGQVLATHPLLTPAEAQQLERWNDSRQDLAPARDILDAFEQQVAATPDAVAVIQGERQLNYGELDRQANQLAHLLRVQGAGEGQWLALCLDKSLELPVAILAVLKTGAAYVPIDPALPQERIRYILGDCASPLLISHSRHRAALEGLAVDTLWLDAQQPILDLQPVSAPARAIGADTPFYAIYTSGSTGQPKGAVVTHGGVCNLQRWYTREFAWGPGDKALLASAIGFDLTQKNLFAPLLTGGTLVLPSQDGYDHLALLEAIRQHGITQLNVAPSAIYPVVEAARQNGWRDLASMRYLILGGEPIRLAALRDWLQSTNSQCQLINSYGPTECTDVVAWHRVDPAAEGRLIPIGRPVDATQLYVLDCHDQPVPVGVLGEICIAGAGVGTGYLNRDDLTAQAFVANPFGAGRLYRTGDLGRYLATGELEFIGRKDFQIKLRGLRIEPGEIEYALRQLDGVRDSLVLVQGERLVAYAVLAPGAVLTAQWREALARFVPAYMVPQALVTLEAWPLSANGKIDRKALPEPVVEDANEAFEAPASDCEQRLAGLWAEVLNVPLEQVGRNANFFHLGGHSLLATVLLTRVAREFGSAPALRHLFEQPTLGALAQVIDQAPAAADDAVAVAGPRPEHLPLSFEQQRLWFLEQLAPGSGEYNMTSAIALSGDLQVAALQQAFTTLVARHELLRSRITEDRAGTRLLIDPAQPFQLPVERFDGADAAWSVHRQQAAEQEARTGFDLARQHPLRARLIQRDDGREALLLFTLHHAAGDGWSVQVLMDELAACYRATVQGQAPALPELSLQYVDYALWQRTAPSQQRYKAQLDYWQHTLENGDYLLDLPTDLPRPATLDNRAGTCFAQLPAALTEQIRQYARDQGVTPYMLLLASLKLFLGRYSGQRDIRIGTPVANRRQAALQPLIGCFVNTLVIRSELAAEQRFSQYLTQVRQAVLAAQEHQDVPFEQVVEHLAPERDLSRTPLFQVAFVMQNSDDSRQDWPGLALEPLAFRSPAAKFDQSWEVHDDNDHLSVMLEYRASLFHEATMQAWLAQWQRFLGVLLASPEARLEQLSPLCDEERQRQLVSWNATERAYPGPVTLGEALSQQARRSPDAPALTDEHTTLSYQALHARADALAQVLSAKGIGRESVVGVCLERSIDLVVALLGIVKAGAAYLPLDPELPTARLAFMLEDASSPLVLTHARWTERLPAERPVLLLDAPLPEVARAGALPVLNQPGDLAYVIYTSGSTGQPKGVLNEHGALMNRLHWMQDAFPIGVADRVLQKTPYSFDVSVWEFFWPLITGACLVMAKPDGHRDSGYLVDLVQRQGITTLHFVPSMLQAFATEPGLERCTTLRQVFASGEALPLALQQRFQQRHPATLINLYGPTEAAIDVSCWVCDPQSALGFVPIGKPIANLALYILDDALEPQPIGAVGQLYIGGAGLARGYLNRPELTAATFIDHPFKPGERLYRTGDRCRFLADGTIQYLGRLDHQVKLRGLRIELGEIDAQLLRQPGIREAATLLRDDLGAPQLVAYLVTDSGSLDVSGIKAALAQTLPAHMVPTVLVELAALPLNSNGKLDRKQLPKPQLDASDEAFEAPQGDAEVQLAVLWAEVLEVPVELIGRRSHFFRLGGHSLLATVLLARLRQRFGTAPALRSLFEQPTLAAFAQQLGQPGDVQGERLVPQVRPTRLPLSFAQQRLWFLEQLNPEAAEYNITAALELSGPVRIDWLQQGLERIVARHEVLRGRLREQGFGAELVIDEVSPLAFSVESMTDTDWVECLDQRVADEARRPFDLAAGPLLRARLLQRQGHDQVLLLLTVHHTVADDWSMQLLIDELSQCYRACAEQREPELPALPVQYVDYALWQRQPAQAERYRAQLQYWQRTLEDGNYLLELPTDQPRRAEPDTASSFHDLVLPEALTRQLRACANQHGVTLYTLLLAATQVLLGRLAGQHDVRLGTAVANRGQLETQALIGCFVNTLVIRGDVAPEQPFGAFLQQVAQRVLEAQEHQDVPFEQVVDALAAQRDMARTPLFQVLFAMQTARLKTDDWAPVTLREIEVPTTASSFDLGWEVHDDQQRLALRLKFKRNLFDASTIARWAQAWQAVLAQVVDLPSATLGELDLLSTEERTRQLDTWNATQRIYPGPHTLVEALAEQLARTPDAPALVYDGECLSYAQLHRRANQLAHRLREHGAGRERIVAVCMNRSVEMVVALLGITQAGAAYLPLDPDLPAARLALVLEDAAPAVILAQTTTAPLLPAGIATWCLDQPSTASYPEHAPAAINQPGDLAYVIYTSGSTGVPKGVLNEHGALLNRLYWMQEAYPIGGEDRVLQKTPYSFDVSVWEFFWPLITGACLVVAKPDGHRDSHYLAELIQRERITTLHFVPSMLQAFVNEPGLAQCRSLRQVFASGEALPLDLQQRFNARHSATLINLYGPTEAAIDVSCWQCDPRSTLGFVPIGTPIANIQLYILDEAQRLVSTGAVGELYIGGKGLARGYLNRPELTAERFVPSPFGAGRLYRTGDRCRFLADGTIQYLGRLDHQVKLRGLRIELGEIDAALLEQPNIEAAVTLLRDDLATPQLVAYLVGSQTLDTEALKVRLGQTLPAHMVPAFVLQLPALPLSSNGKIDRKALPKPEVERRAEQHQAPTTATEEVLCGLLGELLGVSQVGTQDNFFALGGDSILGLQFIAQARAQGIGLTPRQLFQQRTLAELAQVATAVDASQAEQGLLEGHAPLLPIQHWLFEQDLAEPGHWNQSVLLTPAQPLVLDALRDTLQALVEQHDGLRLRFTHGDGQWQQHYGDSAGAVQVEQIMQTGTSLQRCIAAHMTPGFDLARGPLIRALLIDRADGSQRLYLVAHHLVVDAVSWRILLEDFSALYPRLAAGQAALPASKTSSYRQWGQRLQQQAQSPAIQRQVDYWLQQGRPTTLPADHPDADNHVADEITLTDSLSVEETQQLQQAQASYRTQGHELLVAALASALSEWTGASAVGLELEGHGRDAPFPELDVSRTVGWFTQLYPVRLTLPEARDTGAVIVAVKEQLRAVTDKALGYGLLRHQADSPLPASRQPVLFNYLGQVDGASGDSLLRLADEALPPHSAAHNRRSHELEVVLAILGGRLQVEMKFAGQRYTEATRDRLLQACMAQLRAVIQHCQGDQAGQLSPADFPLAKALDQKSLDKLLGKLKTKPISQS